MGFLDDIVERLTAAPSDRPDPEAAKHLDNSTSGKLDEHLANTGNDDLWLPSEQDLSERKRLAKQKPERLSFLQPCPLCSGRAFVHILDGGFVCRTCQPGFSGKRVEATGEGRLVTDQNLKMANDPDPTGDHPAPIDSITDQEKKHFMNAWPWIKENKQRLLDVGWTRAHLLQRSKFRWPYGTWGMAWLPTWSRTGVLVTIGRKGEIIFTYQSCERTITQAAHFPIIKKKHMM